MQCGELNATCNDFKSPNDTTGEIPQPRTGRDGRTVMETRTEIELTVAKQQSSVGHPLDACGHVEVTVVMGVATLPRESKSQSKGECMNETKPLAVGYIRMSTDQQQDSPARQRKDVQALADRLGYHIIKWYEDHGLSTMLLVARTRAEYS